MKDKFLKAHMKAAQVYASLSSAKRLQVGAVVVKDNRIISIGYNGTPTGWDNNCEDFDGKTKPEVIHAEANAIAKLASSHESGKDATMFVTHAPCMECAKLVYNSGIRSLYYREAYRNDDGIAFLKRCNFTVKQLENE
jgi:dCMP deaminase